MIYLEGNELIDKWHIKQAEITTRLILNWFHDYKNILKKAIKQER